MNSTHIIFVINISNQTVISNNVQNLFRTLFVDIDFSFYGSYCRMRCKIQWVVCNASARRVSDSEIRYILSFDIKGDHGFSSEFHKIYRWVFQSLSKFFKPFYAWKYFFRSLILLLLYIIKTLKPFIYIQSLTVIHKYLPLL